MEHKHLEDKEQLNIEEIIGLLDSPIEDVSSYVYNLLKNLLMKINDRWLIDGLLKQFLQSKSKLLLNIILWSPEHHWKLLMDKIQEGLKGADKFQYMSILLYAVSANPLFPWVKKLPDHPIMKDVLHSVNPYQENDVSVIVTGLMFLVVLLPTVPGEMVVYLTKMLDLFWMLMQHAPLDNALKVYLQIAVFAFFQRLYALYPCRLVGFLRYHSDDKSLYQNTLEPMLAKVRLHPFLLTETKETEVRKERWRGKGRHDLVQECAQISLDTFMDIPEGVSYATHFRSKASSDRSTGDLGNYFSVKSEARIWSPGVALSPARSSTSITPVYSAQFSRTMSRASIPESPLETAVEAISQTATPSQSPLIAEGFSPKPGGGGLVAKAQIFPSSGAEFAGENVKKLDTKAMKKEIDEFLSDAGQSQNFFANLVTPHTADAECEVLNGTESRRRRKPSVYSREVNIEEELSEDCDELNKPDSCSGEECDEARTSGNEAGTSGNEARTSGNEGLGEPSQASWSELMKSVHTKRLRFLSQCGPPPNISMGKVCSVGAPSGPEVIPKLRRSRSFPSISDNGSSRVPSSFVRKDFGKLSSLPPKKELHSVCTQTELAAVLDPYEQLIEALQGTPAFPKDNFHLRKSPNVPDQMAFDALEAIMKKIDDGIYSSDISFEWANHGEGTRDSFMKQLRCLFALLKVEKFKKEVYAERNKRLFSKIKHCAYLTEKQKSLEFDLKGLSDEVAYLRNYQNTLKSTIMSQDKRIVSMTADGSLEEIQIAYEAALTDKTYLKELCKSLSLEKDSVREELKCSESKLEDAKQKLLICAFHSEQNEVLKSQLQSHQKQILLMGELYQEMQAQLSTYQNPEHFVSAAKYQEYSDRVEEERMQTRYESREQTTRLRTATLRIYQLQDTLREKDQYIARQQAEMVALENSWREKYSNLSSRQGASEGSVLDGFADTDGHGSAVEEN